MIETMGLPEIAVQVAGITVHGTGFDREMLPVTAGFVLFMVWVFRGAPMPGRIFDGAIGLFVVGLVALAVLFGCSPEAFGSFGDVKDGAFTSISGETSDIVGVFAGGLDFIVPAAGLILWFIIPSGKGGGE